MKKTGSIFCFVVLFVLFVHRSIFPQSLKINEFMATNSHTIKDPDYNNYADWIEIYNYGSESINLKNYYITDNFSQPQKYQFTTDLFIPSGSFILIWADDKNTGVHTNFKLSASGEVIGLYNPSVELIDTITFGEQQEDLSYGRFPDGASNWFYFSPSSPGSVNLEVNIFNRLALPSFSLTSGFYTSQLSLTITHPDNNVTIRYTRDGSTPTTNSLLYSTPVQIESTLVIKARAFKEGFKESKTQFATYFINETTQLPVFSLSTNPENFFSDTSGIYVAGTNGIIAHCSTEPRNWNQDWERPIDIQMFEKDRTSGFSVSAGVQIYGGCARLYAEKSLGFYFRGIYGYDKLNYKLFPGLSYAEYNNFVLRSSGQDWWRTMFRDGMVQTLIGQNTKVDVQAYRPSVVFINGQYWGIHNIREKLNEHYVNSHYGVDGDSIDLVEISKGIVANNGDLIAYNSMISFLTSNDISIPANYEYIKSIIDLDEYIDYMCAEIYSANGDWPGANTKIWRERKPTGKFRWMVYDLDFTFGGNSQGLYNTNTIEQATATNGPSWPNPPWSTLMLRKLLANTDFKNEFIQRFAAHINTTFQPSRVLFVIDSLKQAIENEIPRHKIRWPQSISLGTDWNVNIQLMRDFAIKRPDAIRGFFSSKFGLTGTYYIIIGRNNPAWGKIFSNTLEIKNNDSVNVFFKDLPMMFKAVPADSYRFVRWEGLSTLSSPEITVLANSSISLTAVFEQGATQVNNEIQPGSFMLYQNYPNPFNPSSTITYEIPSLLPVSLKIVDALGREVKTLVDEVKEPGKYDVFFNGENLPSGIYFARIISGSYTKTIKMTLLK